MNTQYTAVHIQGEIISGKHCSKVMIYVKEEDCRPLEIKLYTESNHSENMN